MTPPGLTEIRRGNRRWINAAKPNETTSGWLKKEFGFLDSDLGDTLPPLQRPKIILRGSYIFMILLFPVYDKGSGEINTAEVDFFIGKNFLATVHSKELLPLEKLYDECGTSAAAARACFNSTPAALLHEILNRLSEDASRMLVHISNDVDEIEKRIFHNFTKDTIWTLLRIKTNIVNFRRSMQSHQLIIRRLVEIAPRFFPAEKLRDYFENLVEKTREIWELLTNYKDTVDALHETNASLIDFRINEIMKTLTIIAVITFPLTLFATLFGMNLKGMPFIDLSYGFWIVVGVIITVAFFMITVFGKKKWL